MPFINDRLEQTERERIEAARLADEDRGASAEIVGPTEVEPVGIESRYHFDVDAIMASVRREILGQEEALEALERMLRIVRADISDPSRPLHTALFLGPTGVGKTEVVRSLARALHGSAEAFCRVDMNTLSQEHYAAAITGAPPGYVGSKEGITVLDQELIEGSLRKPGIVLFDELEKASDEVVEALLNVFDNGMLTVASGGRTYSFRNTLIFMTSNLGARRLQRAAERRERPPGKWFLPPRSAEREHRIAEEELLARFAPEFVNRIDSISVFGWLDGDTVDRLVDAELVRLNRRLAKHRVRLHLDESVRKRVIQSGYDRKFGARSMRRAFRHLIEAPLANFLLTEPHPSGESRSLLAVMLGGEVVFRLRE
ncbi:MULTISPECIES: AAA family ATPase [unclassified Guyparkeria]|uniref:AAA family ATPase n=1 Tax=unclassified Guyparkeria TaxID=2626246 RepID=UPI0007339AE2|nr:MULTISPECIES: AAA family ATPase [unclassified Guyparkeria]KTG16996.1 AAA family ATPase [Guyparkeria sp. XI15]OAE86030.1 AAA family ATPase [Guyparkeria sp. WRN-7]